MILIDNNFELSGKITDGFLIDGKSSRRIGNKPSLKNSILTLDNSVTLSPL
ncbi:hypothetical protein VIBNISOn1_800023 [Vibrio nigripulchritudo SOn1]|uniref:Uncharacterized protein n=1 Tax=Vibrio nigripulchritudo SOn1 TaxID=1238450 RepID=A0AAV2VWY9_9VIBR|nr:hypothetical protein VIBNISOn1_800023 [Vibrio nigripulchritudo SOn1]